MTDNQTRQFVDTLISEKGSSLESLLGLLYGIQNRFGYLPQPALEYLCEITEITPANVIGVATFYDIFRFSPAGKYTINVCVGTACHVKGAQSVFEAFKRSLKISPDNDTDTDKLFTVRKVACLGCCTLAPAVQIDQTTYGHVSPDTVSDVIENFLLHHSQKSTVTTSDKGEVHQYQGETRIGLGSCCVARGSEKIRQALIAALDQTGIKLRIKHVGCVGICSQTPLLEIVMPDQQTFLYARVQPHEVKDIILRHFKPTSRIRSALNRTSHFLDRLLTDSLEPTLRTYPLDQRDPILTDFLTPQHHITTENCGTADPTDLTEYQNTGGFSALGQCLQNLNPDQIINMIKTAGLRGRGGAGYPAHLKWSAVKNHHAETKYLICNGDEGDPGAFMDRMLMESYPFRVIEGIIIAAFTLNIRQGYFYIRAEYPLAIRRVTQALEICRRNNLLGPNILQSDFSFDLKITPGAGAFVCGEETALIAGIEGRRGMPRLRPPYPAQKGLWSQPTLINNVETFASVPYIINKGPDHYAQLGTAQSKGTKVFALAGKVAHGGLIEVPMGITIRQVVEKIGGGIANNLKFKAVQVGGPSGGCIPAHLANTPIDYESLKHVNAIMGSGGLVVLDETDCMVDIARYFLQFTQDQSCGRCTPCRVGTRRMLEILDRLCTGTAQPDDLDQLRQLASYIQSASLCALGSTAPNPVISTLEHFPEEYQAHLQGRCPTKKCKALITFTINDECIGCTLCAQHCPTAAIEPDPYQKHHIDPDKCVKCGTCKNICPTHAVEVE